MATTTPNGNNKFVACSYTVSTCSDTSLLRIRGLCRQHFVMEHVDKLTRAESYYLKELDKIQTQKKRVLAELSVAEQVHVSHDLRLLCHKCGVVTMQGYMALQQHEIYCTGKNKTTIKGKSKPRVAKAVIDDDDDEEMTDTE